MKDGDKTTSLILTSYHVSHITYHHLVGGEQEVAAISTRRYRKNIIKSKEDQDA